MSVLLWFFAWNEKCLKSRQNFWILYWPFLSWQSFRNKFKQDCIYDSIALWIKLWQVIKSIMTFWLQSGDILMTLWWRSDDVLMTFWWHLDDTLMTFIFTIISKLMSGSSHIRRVLIGIEYRNCHQTLDVYLHFAKGQ